MTTTQEKYQSCALLELLQSHSWIFAPSEPDPLLRSRHRPDRGLNHLMKSPSFCGCHATAPLSHPHWVWVISVPLVNGQFVVRQS